MAQATARAASATSASIFAGLLRFSLLSPYMRRLRVLKPVHTISDPYCSKRSASPLKNTSGHDLPAGSGRSWQSANLASNL